MTLRRTKTAKASSTANSQVEQGNFWDVGNYKAVLKRITNTPKLCDEFYKMFHERASVEKHYAKELSSFAEKWEEKLQSKIPEFGTMLDGWHAVTAEARQLSAHHMAYKDKVQDIMKDRIETWKKEHCKKSIIHLKSYKRANSAFEKAQGPWNKRKGKIDKYRSHIIKYRKEMEVLRQNPADHPPDKIQSLVKKAERELKKANEKLKQRIAELYQYKDVYRQEMTLEFQRCQEEEHTRMMFFQETLRLFHKITKITDDIEVAHAHLSVRVEKMDPNKDLATFAHRSGIAMPMIVPDENGVWYEEGNTPPSQGGQVYQPAAIRRSQSNAADTPMVVEMSHSSIDPSPPSYSATTTTAATTTAPPAAHFLEPPSKDEHGGSDWSLASNGDSDIAPGDVVRALYDFTGSQEDELTFVEGDEIEVLEAADDDGWLKGKHQTWQNAGKFPGNYVVKA